MTLFEKATKILSVEGNGAPAIAPFINCVNTYFEGKFPDKYLEIIATPMHYGLILEKLIEHSYAVDTAAFGKKNSKAKPGREVYCLYYPENTYAEVLADISLIRSNAEKYYNQLPDKDVSVTS